VVIEPAPSLDRARTRLQSEAKSAGTWGAHQDSKDAWAQAAADKLAHPNG
jgi:hypothetical protein